MSRPNGLRAALRGKRIALAVTAAFLPYGEAHALPTGEQVVIPDSVTVTRPTAQTMQIDQTIQKAIVNWQGFSIGASEHVNITQPNAGAALLNRVIGNEASQIFGRLTANGQVFLVNNAGVLFAPGASVEVGSLLASSLSISNQNFLNGTYQFYNPGGAGSVTNAGSIITPGGFTALFGPQVRNDGVIVANAGRVALAAGNAVSLTVGDGLISVVVDEAAYNASVVNTGSIEANGGTVLLKASSANALLDTVINTSGVIRAVALVEQNGEIVLDGGGANGGIVATGETQAGRVAISGGSLQVQRLVPDPMMLNGLIAADTIDVSVAGGVVVERGGQVTSRNGQTITADSLTIRAQAGEFTTVRNESGDQVITATGAAGITVQAELGGSAILGKPVLFGGAPAPDSQTITTTRLQLQGGSIEANAQDITVHGDLSVLGGSIRASIGEQTITVDGGSIDVRAVAPGSGAFIGTFGGKQSIAVTDGDHIRIIGEAGAAGIQSNFGHQTVSITGSGANALQIGSETATGSSVLTGANQRITAGSEGESGSISIQGAGADGMATFIANVGLTPATGQIISTSGTLNIKGGAAGQNRGAGIFQNSLDRQEISAAEVILEGGAAGTGNGVFINSTFGGGQLFNVDGQLKLAAGAGGAAGMFNGSNSPDTISAAQTIDAGSVVLEGGAGGTNNSAFISSQFGGAQTLTVPGEMRITGGAGGNNNRAGLLTNANQTITGNPTIVLKGGDGGGVGGPSNNVFIQATGPDTTVQTINARSIEIRSGAGFDASATFNAARNVITTTGDVSIYGGAGQGGSNGARIGGIGGTTLGPTNLTLRVGGDLLVHGGTVNGASLGSSGSSTQSNTITVTAANVKLESEGAGARIGASNQTPLPSGTISVTATGDLQVGTGTAIRASGPVTPPVGTPPTAITLTANSLTNDGTITNGGGTNTANVALIANAFDLNGGNIQGGNAAVILRPRDGTRSFGIEAAGATTLTNADLASINTTNFVVLGSGTGLNFTGDMTIGQNARVDGGTKGLAFFRSVDPLARTGSITIGAQGVTTAGGADVIVGAGKGNIISGGGTVSGDEVQLRASTGIGADGARVNTAANALAINNGTGAAFVSEADDVTLRNVNLTVGGVGNNFGNSVGGSLDLSAGGTLGVTDIVSSFGGQAITAQAVNVTAQGGRTAQLLNTVGDQTLTAGTIDVQTGVGGGLAEIRNNSAGQQTLSVTGEHLNVHGLGGGVANVFAASNQLIETTSLGARRITLGSDAALGASTINAGGDQTITGRADIFLTGGAGPVQDGHNALIVAFNPTRTQRIEAGNLTLANSTLGGNNSVAAILGANQLIDATGDVTLTANASLGSLPGVRIGGLGGGGGAATGTNLTLTLDGDLVLTGGTLSGNGVGIGSTASPTAPPLANNITITAPNGNVILNSGVAGSGVRIGAPQTDGGIQSGGNIAITAGGDIRLNGVEEFASIRTRDSVTLSAANITEAAQGRVIAGSLSTTSSGGTLLTGPNEVAVFNATSSAGDVTLANTGALQVTGMNAFGDATLANAGNVTVGGPWTAGGTSVITVGSDIVLASSLSSDQVILTANGGSITESGGSIVADSLTTVSSADTTLNGANQVATFSATSTGGDVTLNNSGALNVSGMSAFGDATIANFGDMAVSGSWTSTASTSITTAGDLNVTSSVSSFGPMHVSVDGTLTVAASGTQPPPPPPTPDFPPFPPAPQFATLTSNAGQDIAAGSIQVLASDGANASIKNQSAGSQTITVTGGRLDVHAASAAGQPSSSAQIGNFTSGEQIVKVIDGAGIDVSGVSGSANISASGAQTVLTTGSSANALTLGAAGNLGSSWISGATQVITAGTGNQAGSITVVGADVGPTFISSGQVIGGTQAVSTSGTLRISGGNVPNQPGFGSASGLYHNGSGEQKVSAAKLEMKGGASGVNNTAIIISSGGAGTIAAGDQVIDVGGGSIELTGGGSGTTNSAIIVSSAQQSVTAGRVALHGGENGASNGAFINSTFGGGQVFNVAGELQVAAGAGGAAGIFNGTNTPLPGTTTPNTNSAPQTINAGSVTLTGAPGGSNNGAFINSTFGGNQTLTVPGQIRITGGAGGTANRAGIFTNANQTINGNPAIVLAGGAGGGAGDDANNVQIRSVGDDTKVQTVNARSIELRSGAGADASATLNAARQVITTTGNASLFGGSGTGDSNGVRIGGIGGTTLGPTNLTLTVGGDLLVHGGTVNGASLGSSGSSAQSNTITVRAANVKLESEGAGARIGASNQTPVPSGTITVTAAGELDVGAGTAIRANGPITLTANSLTNDGTITNGGGTNTGNVALIANAFDLNGGNIQGGNAAVIVRPRDGTRSFGIESAGDTTLTNADLAKISTTNFVVLGSGMGTTFTGDMTIGQNAQVNGGTKGLAFLRTSDPLARSGSITIGAQGITSGSDVIVGAGNGSIISAGGTISGDEVQLRASTGIGADGAGVHTSANALAINNSAGAVFVSEADHVTLRNVNLTVGGIGNNFGNLMGGSLELSAGGALSVTDVVSSTGGQTITAQSVNVTAQGGRLAQLLNTVGDQTITAGTIDVQTGVGGGTAEIRNNSAGQQQITVTGDHLNVHGLGGGVANVFAGGNQLIETTGLAPRRITLGSEAALGASTINAGGDQIITGRPDIFMTGGAGPIQDGHNALIVAFNPIRTQSIEAGNLTLANSTLGGNNSVAAILGATQLIDATGDVTLTANASLGSLPGVRIGGLGGGGASATGTNLTLTLDGDLILTGGTLSGNGVGIGSTASPSAPPLTNFITIDAGGSVILESREAGAGARIGNAQNGPTPGAIKITAGRDIRLDGVAESTVIRNAGSVELHAANISEASKGAILTTSLSTDSTGSTTLTGPNQVVAFEGRSGGDLTFTNIAALQVTGVTANSGAATLTADGAMSISGPVAANTVVLTANGGGIDEFGGGSVVANSLTTVSTADTTLNGANEVAIFNAASTGGDVTLNNSGALTITGMSAFGDATITNLGDVTVSGPWNSSGATSITTSGVGSDLTVTNNVVSGGAMSVDVAGALAVTSGAGQNATLTSSGGQIIEARSVDVQTSTGGGLAEIRSNGSSQQRITVSGDHLNVQALAGGFAAITSGGDQRIEMTSAGAKTIAVGADSALGSSSIFSGGDQAIDGKADLFLTGNGTGIVGGGANATIDTASGRSQTIDAGKISLTNSLFANSNTVVGMRSSHQTITSSGDFLMTAGQGTQPGTVQIRGSGSGATDLHLTVGGSLLISGGNAPGSGIGLGSSNVANNIDIQATGDVIVNSGANGARIGSSSDGTVGGNISISARSIELNGTDGASAAIRTLDVVTLHADQPGGTISESGRGRIIAGSLVTTSNGNTSLAGPNQVGVFNATSTAGDLSLNNTGALDVTGMSAFGDATIVNVGNVTVSGPWSAGRTSTIAVGSDIVLASSLTSTDVVLTADGSITESSGTIQAERLTTVSTNATSLGGENRVRSYSGNAGSELFLFNRGDLEVTSLNAATANLSNNGAVTISGPWVTSGQTNITAFGFGAALSESAGGFIQASGFNGLSGDGGVSLGGPNRISGTLNGSSMQGDFRLTNAGDLNFGAFSSFGDVNLVNAGVLTVTNVSGRNVAVANTGPTSVAGFWNSQAATSITTSGAGADLTIASSVFSNGPMTVNVDGALIVTAGAAPLPPMPGFPPLQQFISLTSNAGQDITARSMRVSAENGGLVFINNQGTGNQNITVTGGDLSIRASGDGVSAVPASTAQVFNFGSGLQTIDVSGALIVAANGTQLPPPPPPGMPAPTSAPQFAILGSASGQHITARAIAVTAEDGAHASINNQSNQVPFSTGTPGGNQTLVVSGGGITIRSSGGAPSGGPGSSSAQIVNSSFGDQAVTGDQLVSVSGGGGIDLLSTGGFAAISNSAFNSAGVAQPGGSQTVRVSGGGNLDVQSAANSGGAFISQSALGGSQTISITDGQRLKVNGSIGNASIGANGGTQTVSITGSGANAIELGSAGAAGSSQIGGGSLQSVVAGAAGDGGSITIVGPLANNAAASIVSRPGAGGTQTITTSGLLSVTGGSAPNQTFGTGVFHNGSGAQGITAAGITLVGGPGGSGNRATIGSFGGGVPANAGHQIVNVAGGQVLVRGGDAGSTNTASIVSSADQTINGNPDLVLIGGASTVPGVADSNFANIQAALGRSQTIHAGTITMTNSGGANTDSFAGINAGHQAITTTGDVRLTANGGSARIGGVGGGATDLELIVGSNLVLDGGGMPTNGTGIGSSGIGAAFANDIHIVATGDVTLNGGASGARIGSAAATGTAGGNISISARSIQLNGTDASAAIRTLGGVTLHADQPGGTISESGRGLIIAGSLVTTSNGDTSLAGPNQIAAFNATSSAGDVSLNNTGVLNVTGMSAFGDATISNLGDVTVSGPWTAGGTSAITVGSSIFLKSEMHSHDVLLVSTTGDIVQEAGASIDAVNLTTSSLGDTRLAGTNTVESIDVSSTEGDVSLKTVSAVLRLTGIDLPGALVVDNAGEIAVTGSVSALSHDLRATGDVTVGGAGEAVGTLLYAPGSISIWTPGAIRVRGSDTAAGAGSAILAGGALNLSAGNVALIGGAAPATPAVARGQSVSMTLDGNLAVTGGSGHLSPAVLSSGSNIDLTVGGVVRVDAGSGFLSLARIQTEIRDGVIHITFPNLSSSYFVNGIEGDNHQGQTGFFTLNKPAKLGSTLQVDYGT